MLVDSEKLWGEIERRRNIAVGIAVTPYAKEFTENLCARLNSIITSLETEQAGTIEQIGKWCEDNHHENPYNGYRFVWASDLLAELKRLKGGE